MRRRVRFQRALCFLAVAFALLGQSARGFARVEFEIRFLDNPGRGFQDPSPRVPVDGNLGVTLGEQRRLAFGEAVAIWASALDSEVPVVIAASFAPAEDLFCDEDSAVLGGAGADSVFRDVPGAPHEELAYPGPLADKLAGYDLDPGSPDIHAVFNPRLDAGECLGGLAWNYGFSARNTGADFVNTVLHELAHGLGFSNLTDELSGEAPGITPFELFTQDNTLGRFWDEMTSSERATSAQNAFGLVWTGSAVSQRAQEVLAEGTPRLRISGDEKRELLLVGEMGFGPPAGDVAVQGRLAEWSPLEACDEGQAAAGQVLMLRAHAACDVIRQYEVAQRRGASAVLFRDEFDSSPPWGVDGRIEGATLPGLTLLASDFDQLQGSLSQGARLDAEFASDRTRRMGTDPHGRVYLSANAPVLEGSSVTHWDRSVRRRQNTLGDPDSVLMEPVASGRFVNQVDDLTVQLLHDIGWLRGECGNGQVEPGEVCDTGNSNSDLAPGACREDCRPARCGDGVVDDGEVCDHPSDCARDCGVVSITPSPVDPIADGGVKTRDAAAPKPLTPDAGSDGLARDAGRPPAPISSVSGGAGCGCRVGDRPTDASGAALCLSLVFAGLYWAKRRFS
ncbi:MAG: hypothetical protein RJA70_3485 [Pseudomonadota bacterium]